MLHQIYHLFFSWNVYLLPLGLSVWIRSGNFLPLFLFRDIIIYYQCVCITLSQLLHWLNFSLSLSFCYIKSIIFNILDIFIFGFVPLWVWLTLSFMSQGLSLCLYIQSVWPYGEIICSINGHLQQWKFVPISIKNCQSRFKFLPNAKWTQKDFQRLLKSGHAIPN